MVNTPQRKRQRLNTRSSNSNSSSKSNSVDQRTASTTVSASDFHHHPLPLPNQVARKRTRASRYPIANDKDNDNASRDLEEDALDPGMKDDIEYQSRPQMGVDMDMEFEVSFVRGEMIGHHQERKECTILQSPEPSWATPVSKLIPSIYDQFIKKIPHDSERMYDPTLRSSVIDTTPSETTTREMEKEREEISTLDKGRTVLHPHPRFRESGPASHIQDHHYGDADEDDGDIDFESVHEHEERETRQSAEGQGDGGAENSGCGRGGLEASTSRSVEESRSSNHEEAKDQDQYDQGPKRCKRKGNNWSAKKTHKVYRPLRLGFGHCGEVKITKRMIDRAAQSERAFQKQQANQTW